MYRPARSACLAGIVLLAACVESPTSPANDRALRPQFSAGVLPVKRMPMSVAYRDPAHHYATGRAGLATLSTRALLGKDGLTTVEVSTGDLNTDVAGTQLIQKTQLKLFDSAGEADATLNDNGLSTSATSYAVASLRRGEIVQVQANVLVPNSSSKNERTGVVTLREPVLLRPDLMLTLSAPDQVIKDRPVTVIANVKELNGDVAARSNCVLYIDGLEADRVPDMLVAEGDLVVCRFITEFSSTGDHLVRVAVEGVRPADWDLANNAAEAVIQVTGAYTPLSGWWQVYDLDMTQHERYAGNMIDTWSGGHYHPIQADWLQDRRLNYQNYYAEVWSPTTVGWPVRFKTRVVSDGQPVIDVDQLLDQNGWYDEEYGGYADGWIDVSGAGNVLYTSVYVGTPDSPYTYLMTSLFAGEIIYTGSGYKRERCCDDRGCTAWWTTTPWSIYGSGGPKLVFGSELTLDMEISGHLDVAGTHQAAAFLRYEVNDVRPWTCRTSSAGQWCEEYNNTGWTRYIDVYF